MDNEGLWCIKWQAVRRPEWFWYSPGEPLSVARGTRGNDFQRVVGICRISERPAIWSADDTWNALPEEAKR